MHHIAQSQADRVPSLRMWSATHPFTAVFAWAGLILYELCTGQLLFEKDLHDNLTPAEKFRLCAWHVWHVLHPSQSTVSAPPTVLALCALVGFVRRMLALPGSVVEIRVCSLWLYVGARPFAVRQVRCN